MFIFWKEVNVTALHTNKKGAVAFAALLYSNLKAVIVDFLGCLRISYHFLIV